MTNNFVTNLRLERQIGAGNFGEVWEGHDPIHGRVAVKVFRRQSNESDDEWQTRKSSLLTEGQRLKDSEHERVVRVFHMVEASDQDAVHLIMEYCDGGCLNDHFKRGPMQISTLRDALTDAAFGLQAVHSRGMLHRDIKPSNILLDGSRHAKIADFGLVTNDLVLGYASGNGYIDHLAPEVFNPGLTSIRTDIWAFGMTVYRLLHGEQFYSELPSPRDSVLQGQFARRLPWLPHIPDGWRRFVRKAMHDDPNQRFQNVSELLGGLERLTVSPDWICACSSDEVYWQRLIKDRKVEVRWKKHSPRKHTWEAVSLPRSDGRARKLAGSSGMIGKIEATEGLEAFFSNAR